MPVGNSNARTGRCGLVCVITCLLVISLSGCKQAAPPLEPVTITLAMRDHAIDDYEALIEKFNKQYPHITVNLRSETGDGLANLRADDADVRPVWQAMFDDVLERGDLLALDPLIDQDESLDLSDFPPAALEVFTTDGRTWAIPTGANPIVMFYNQDLFDRYGVPYPEVGWTWDDFLSSALALRNSEAGVFGYASGVERADVIWFVYQHGGRLFDDMQNPAQVTLNDPLTVEALEWYAGLYHEYDVATTRFPGGQGVRQGILANKVGMWSYNISEQGGQGWPAKWPMRWGMVTLPRDTHRATGGICLGFSISSQTQHPDAAWELVTFISRQPWELVVPARRSVAESIEYIRLAGEDIAAVTEDARDTSLFYSPRIYSRFDGVREIFFEAVNRVISRGWTAQEALDWAQGEAEASIEP